MGKKHDILYVNFYTSGSAARKIELTPPRPIPQQPAPEPTPTPAPARRTRTRTRPVIHVDLLAVASILVSAVMLMLMAVGMVKLNEAHAQQTRAEAYVQNLREENAALAAEFEEQYDPAAVEEAALALGMVPADQVEHITVTVRPTVETIPEPTLWEQVLAFFEGLFA